MPKSTRPLGTTLVARPVSQRLNVQARNPLSLAKDATLEKLVNRAEDSVPLWRELLHYLKYGPDDFLVDAGCGSGAIGEAAILEGLSVVGLDTDTTREGLQRRGALKRIHLLQGRLDEEHKTKKGLRKYQREVRDGLFRPLLGKSIQKEMGKRGDTPVDVIDLIGIEKAAKNARKAIDKDEVLIFLV